ncbi:MAG: HIT domain-containing protein [Deltaproteobacteria bacterium]|nr:HIT domain-containing protein [Deltaproteobacteria bacterium]
MSSDACAFCFPEEIRIFHTAELVLGLWDRYPVSPGHALLIPRRHVTSWFDANQQEQAELTEAITVAQHAIRQRHSPDGFNIGVNVGEVAGQTISHVHVHVIPRYRGDVDDPRGGVRHVIPNRAVYGDMAAGPEIVAEAPASYQPTGHAPPLERQNLPIDQTVVAFGERMLQLLDQTRRTATYKFAVLLGLIDLCLEQSSAGGEVTAISTRDLAEKVLELYWPHTAAFAGNEGLIVLRQISGGNAEMLAAIGDFRRRHAADPSQPLSRARHRAPKEYERIVSFLQWKLIQMPLPKLQRIGNSDSRFLYDISWDDKVTRSEMQQAGFDNNIHLRPEVGTNLARLSGLLRPLIQRGWSTMVARLNPSATDEARLQEFLFGAARICLDPVRADLRELQNNRCFYCAERLDKVVDVDHFVPWARYPDNGIENLVATHSACNNAKSDFLAAGDHVQHWGERFAARNASLSSQLANIAARAAWDRRPQRTLNVARSIYLALPPDVQLWLRRKDFVPAAGERWAIRHALEAVP